MIKSQVYRVTAEEMTEIKATLVKDDAMFIVEFDGEEMRTEKDFFDKAWALFSFPTERHSWDGFNDWIRDPFYYKGDKFALIIHNNSCCLEYDKDARGTWFRYIFQYILPFWEDKVERVVTRGKKMPYSIYFVD